MSNLADWFHDDKTWCISECANLGCERNLANRHTKGGLFSAANFKDTETCPLNKFTVIQKIDKALLSVERAKKIVEEKKEQSTDDYFMHNVLCEVSRYLSDYKKLYKRHKETVDKLNDALTELINNDNQIHHMSLIIEEYEKELKKEND